MTIAQLREAIGGLPDTTELTFATIDEGAYLDEELHKGRTEILNIHSISIRTVDGITSIILLGWTNYDT